MDSPPVPRELLVDIFLRLPDPADLVRAAAACVSFRSIVADRSFLRQYRKLHAPPLLGFIVGRNNFQPATAPAASAVALAADFSFAFLPSSSNWLIEDVCDGRVLLYEIRRKKGIAFTFIDLVVCDPLHRQYLLLPPIPDEVFTSVEKWHTFLVPPADNGVKEEAAEETSFRVIWMARCGDKLVALVFSSGTGQWQAGPSHSWSDSFPCLLSRTGEITLSLPQYAYGCFYWVTTCRKKLLVLDTGRMEFSIADAPPEAKGFDCMNTNIVVVEAGEGRPGMFVLPVPDDTTTDLKFIIRHNSGGSSGQWKLDKTISLGFRYYFAGSMGRLLFLCFGRSHIATFYHHCCRHRQ
uniref:Uncharacterized protein n=1 Tax=Avena sativa TaxID=4498 RepID=A0ACD5Z3J2_AVESA